MEEPMKKTDKILIGIVSGIILLVVVAFIFALNKPKPTYQAEDEPGGVAFNYLFALQQKDYERAYSYLSPSMKGYPKDTDAFMDDIRDRSWSFRGLNDSSTTLEVDSVSINGKRADVKIQETHFYEGDLFNSGQYSNTFDITLRQDENGQWKIVESDSYWLYCWSDPKSYGCK
jgi:hypothetical protein